MEAITSYLLKSTIWLTGFALIYMLFLRNERFFSLNRIFLISGALGSICFPLINWHYVVELPMVLTPEDPNFPLVNTAISTSESPVLNPLFLAYLSGTCFLFFRLIKQIVQITGIIRKSEITKFNSVKLIRTNRYAAPFSFFSFVFVNPSTNDIETNEIVHHEAEHIRQKHWIDLLLFETLCIIQWFNPMIWLYGRFIRQNHEYLADEKALQRTANPAIYRATLLNQMFDAPVIQLANSFNYSLNKKRFSMMKQTINSPIRKLKLLLVFPLIGGVFYAFASPEYKLGYSDMGSDNPVNTTEHAVEAISGVNASSEYSDQKSAPESALLQTEFEKKKDKKTSEKPVINVTPSTIDSALILLDGLEISKAEMEKEKPENIESISILKNESAKALYGEDAKNGVVIITSKSDSEKTTDDMAVGSGTQNSQHSLTSDGKIVIRDTDPSMSKNPPLIVIDGTVQKGKKISDIDPETISSIAVLKDENATKKYGVDGGNGVIEITTKSASNGIPDKPILTPEFSKGKLIIAPNPTDNNATITLEDSDSQNKLDVSIFDHWGKLVKKEQKTGPSFNISVTDLIIGTYYLLVTDGTIQYTGTLQIAK